MDAEVKAEKLREDERMLQAIDKCISSRDDHYERNKAILTEILEDVFDTMKGRDAFFREQFQEFCFVEKYYKGPTVINPEEFDVNIIIEIPLHYFYIQLGGEKPGYKWLKFSCNVSLSSQWHKHSKFMSNWVKYNNCTGVYEVDSSVFQQSMQSLLGSAMLNVPKIDKYTIKVCKNGPAFTQMCVTKQGFREMNVNLMPVLELDSRKLGSLAKGDFKWYAVPDPLKDKADGHLQWRMALKDHDNDLLTRHSYLTPAIRQLEKLRDILGWKVIPHFHIKTLVMHYARSIENNSGLPDKFKLTGIKLLIHILDRLRIMCKTRYLENVWFPGHNLVEADESQFANIVEQLTTMISEITDDPAKLADWILTSEELSMYENELKTVGILQDTDCPSNDLQTSEGDEPGSSGDIRNTADDVAEPVTSTAAASGSRASSPSTEARDDEAGCPEEMDKVTTNVSSHDALLQRVTAIEEKLAAMA